METGRTHSSSRARRTWLAALAVILVSGPVLTHDALCEILREIASEEQWTDYEGCGDLDFAYGFEGVARFRANFLRQENGAAAVFRIIPEKIVTLEELRETVGEVRVDPALEGDAHPPRSPGMKYRHYAPEGELWLVEGSGEALVLRIRRLARRHSQGGAGERRLPGYIAGACLGGALQRHGRQYRRWRRRPGWLVVARRWRGRCPPRRR